MDALQHTLPEIIPGVFPRLFFRLFCLLVDLWKLLFAPDFPHDAVLFINQLKWRNREVFLRSEQFGIYFGPMLSHVFQNLCKISNLLLHQALKIDIQVPLFIGLLHRKVSLLIFPSNIDDKGVEVKVSGSNLDSLEGFLPVLSVEVAFLGVIEGKGLRRSLIVVLLQGVEILACLCMPDFNFTVEGRGHDDISILNVLEHLDGLGVGFNLPL